MYQLLEPTFSCGMDEEAQEFNVSFSASTNEEGAGARDYDVVVFGSTGFTGQFVNEELYRVQQDGQRTLKWAAAGRSKAKLEACLRDSNIEGIDTVIADINDQSSLENMCSKATVLINCVGPYQLYGEQVVKACIAQKTNYVDITGETYFMETIAARYDEEARAAGIYIVSACAFDCIPNDLGAFLLQKTFNGDLSYVESYMKVEDSTKAPSRFNTGTWESFLRSIRDLSKLKTIRKQQNQQPLVMPAAKPPSRKPIFYSDLISSWCLPFPGPDKAVVYRTMMYRKNHEGVDPFNFRLYFGTGSFCQAIGVVAFMLLLLPMVMTKCGLWLLLKFPSFFSFGYATRGGPSRKELETITFVATLHGTGYMDDDDRSKPPKSKVTVKVRGIDPGYGATSALVVQSALCMVNEKDNLPPAGGVYTPAVAFGNTRIIQNLENTGKVKFEVRPN